MGQSQRFFTYGFFHRKTNPGPLFHTLLLFVVIRLQMAEILKFEAQSAQWPLAQNQFFSKLGEVSSTVRMDGVGPG